MDIVDFRCPMCNLKTRVYVELQPYAVDEDAAIVFRAICCHLAGIEFEKDDAYISRIDKYHYKYNIKILDSPEGDEWIEGVAYWNPASGEFKLLRKEGME